MASPSSLHVTALYGERQLHKTLSIPRVATVGTTKELAKSALEEHLRSLPGVPSDILFDPDCTDFYPEVAQDADKIGDLNGQITVVFWPTAGPSGVTTSPIIEALTDSAKVLPKKVTELNAQPTVSSASTQRRNRKGEGKPTPTSPTDTITSGRDSESGLDEILLRLKELEESHTKLEERNTRLEERNAKLEERIDAYVDDTKNMRELLATVLLCYT